MRRLLLALGLLCLTGISALAGSQEVTLGANGNSAPIPLNLVGWNPVSLLVTFSPNANLTCGVQISNDGYNIRDNRGNPIPMVNWNNHDTMVNMTITNTATGATGFVNPNGNIYFPVVAVRLVASNWVAGTCTLALAQVGP